MQVNTYFQGLWFVASLILIGLGLLVGWLAVVLIAIQLVCFYSQLRKAPVKYWPYYFALNYVVMMPQLVAVLRGTFISKSVFYKTDKKEMKPYE